MNKNKFKTILKDFFESQSQLNLFLQSKNLSSAHIITSFFNSYITNNSNVTQHVSTINIFNDKRTKQISTTNIYDNTTQISTINILREKRIAQSLLIFIEKLLNHMLSSLRFMFDNHFTSINMNNERILFNETQKIVQRA